MGRPLVFAHRGASEALPEHTLAAYLHALGEGSDGLECDVRLTRDGHLVCVHDRRLNRTSNGRGRVSRHTLAELDALDFGSWHGAIGAVATALEQAEEERTRLLTFPRLLDAVRAVDRPVRLLVETKHPSRYGPEVEHKLVRQLARYGLAEPVPGDPVNVTVMSFSALALRRVRRLAPRLPTVYLMEMVPPGVGAGRLPFGSRIAGPSVGLARSRPHLVPTMRAAGHRVYAWTVNHADEVNLLVGQGVDGLITDRPGFVLNHLG